MQTPHSELGTQHWLDLETASQRMGRSIGHIARMCRSTWASAGLARLMRPAGGGKPAWHVSDAADPSLAAVKFPAQLDSEFDLRTLSDRQRDTIQQRKRILAAWETQLAAGAALNVSEAKITASFIDRLLVDENLKISRGTLFNWRRSYRRLGVAGLLDGRGIAGDEAPRGDDPFFAFVQRLYLTPRKLKLTRCHEFAVMKAAEEGWPVRSYKACQRFIDALPRQLIIRQREGEKAFVDQCEPFIERDYSTLDSNDLWCGDHHRFDVMVRVIDPRTGEIRHVRPWLTAWQDMRSRKIAGWQIFAHDPNTDTILAAFVAGCQEHGLPRQVYIDNGKDFDARALQGRTKRQRKDSVEIDVERMDGAFNLLGVEVTHVWPYHGQSKPIERFFGTLADRFARTFETYCGGTTAGKPHDLARQMDLGKAPSMEEFVAAFGDWLAGDYHARAHSGDAMDGRSPDQVFAECLLSKRAVLAEQLAFATLPRVGPVSVGQHGVRWKGISYGAFNPKVQQLFGQSVRLAIDNSSVNSVYLLDLDGRLICRAEANAKLPVNADSQTLRQAIAEKRSLRRTHKQYIERRPRMGDDVHQLVRRRAVEQAAAQRPDVESPSIAPVRTGFDDQLDVVARALRTERHRVAVGAENLDLDRLRPQAPALPAGDSDDLDVFAAVSAAMQRQTLRLAGDD